MKDLNLAQVIELLSGIALFLFGMTLMGDGLKRLSGNRLEPVLFRLTSTPLKGVALGAGVTAVIQSSSATSVMVVGFVNAGMMKLPQAIHVIIGSMLGTSITGWVICLSYIEGASALSGLLSAATLTGIMAVSGIILRMFSKNPAHQRLGDILMGFVVLMSGMSTMSGATASLGERAWFLSLLSSLKNPLLGILAGALFCAVLQSASAAVGILQALSITGAITLESALPILMGIAVGASVPVLLSALGANTAGKRAAMVYLVGSFSGMVVCASLFYIGNALFRFPFLTTVMNPFSLAFVNTVFRFIIVLLLTPLSDVLESMVIFLVPEKGEKEEEEEFIPRMEERFIQHPALAIEQSRTAMKAVAELASKSMELATGLLSDYHSSTFRKVEEMEKRADTYEDSLGSYLVNLTGRELTPKQNQSVSVFLHTLPDFERITDHALEIAYTARSLRDQRLSFSEGALAELPVLISATMEVTCLAEEAFSTGDLTVAERVEPLEEVIDTLSDEMKLRHVERLQNGQCTIQQSMALNDLIASFERVSDHCSNVAAAIIELSTGTFDTHAYLGSIKKKGSPAFERMFEEYRTRFALPETA